MTKQEIVNSLTNKRNFKKSVELCFADSELDVNELPLKYAPEIYVYKYDKDDRNGVYELNIFLLSFEVDGVMLKGVKEFFKNYEKITRIIEQPGTTDFKEFIVKPNIVKGHDMWYENVEDSVEGYFEISFDCHSFDKPSYIMKEEYEGVKYVVEEYYVDGDEVTKEQATFLGREYKLSRICGVDLKNEREEKEQLEKEEQKRIEKEKKNKRRLNEDYIFRYRWCLKH